MSHSPPSPSSAPPAKRARVAEDIKRDVKPTLPSSSSSTALTPKVPKHTKQQKPNHRKAPPIDSVLLIDLLTVLSWPSLPKPSFPASEAETLGKRLWPSKGPKDRSPEESSVGWEFSEVELEVVGLSSHGDGLAVWPAASTGGKAEWVVIVPFTLPGDKIRAKITRNCHYHSYGEPLNLPSTSTYTPPTPTTTTTTTTTTTSLTTDTKPLLPPYSFPLPLTRDLSLAKCKYFTSCAGCQYQYLPYETQLALKRLVLEKAMRNFSGLKEGTDYPEVGGTIPSPEQWGYRTKITPHFELPKQLQTGKKGRQDMSKVRQENVLTPAASLKVEEEEEMVNDIIDTEALGAPNEGPADEFDLPIGFNLACRPRILDIEDCPIATPVIRAAMPGVRAEVKRGIRGYKRGATLLFRDSLVVEYEEGGKVKVRDGEGEGERVCVGKHMEKITERVGGIVFQFPAGSFFQNNSSILVPLTEYVKTQVVGFAKEGEETYLVDAYCGSGLFSLCLADSFTKVLGIEIDPQSISYAKHNAQINSIPNAFFHAGASESIFDSVISPPGGGGLDKAKGDHDRTVLIVDPPRKGCDEAFLRQVVRFRPRVMVYVSCNVHTMAENVGLLIRLTAEALKAEGKSPEEDNYKIQSLRAIDLFPQTHHAEGLLVLRRN